MARRIGRIGKKAYKFNYALKFHSITLEATQVNFCPNQLSISFSRKGKRLNTKFAKWEASIRTPCHGVVVFPDLENLESIVTLYRGQKEQNYEKKEWDIVVVELTKSGKRRVLGKNTINMVDFVGDATGISQDLLVKLKPTSRKIRLIEIDANIFSRFERSGNTNDFDMKSITSMMSISQLSSISEMDDLDLRDLDIDLENLDDDFFEDEATIEKKALTMFSPPSFIDVDYLLQWCQEITEGYHVSVRNFTTSWRNGLAFAAIIHKFHPELIDFNSLNPQDLIRNCKLSFETAASLGVPRIIKPEQMDEWLVPDRLTVTAYVYQLYINFERTENSQESIKNEDNRAFEGSIDYALLPKFVIDSTDKEINSCKSLDTELSILSMSEKKEMTFTRSVSENAASKISSQTYDKDLDSPSKREKVHSRSSRRKLSEDSCQQVDFLNVEKSSLRSVSEKAASNISNKTQEEEFDLSCRREKVQFRSSRRNLSEDSCQQVDFLNVGDSFTRSVSEKAASNISSKTQDELDLSCKREKVQFRNSRRNLSEDSCQQDDFLNVGNSLTRSVSEKAASKIGSQIYEKEFDSLNKCEKVEDRSVKPNLPGDQFLNDDIKRRVQEFLKEHPLDKSIADRSEKQEKLHIQAKELLQGRTGSPLQRKSNSNSPLLGKRSSPTPHKYLFTPQDGNKLSNKNVEKSNLSSASLEKQFTECVSSIDKFDLDENLLFKIANNAFNEDQSSLKLGAVPIEVDSHNNSTIEASSESLPKELMKGCLGRISDQNTINIETNKSKQQLNRHEFIASSYKTLSSTESNISDTNSISSPETNKLFKRLSTNKKKSERNSTSEDRDITQLNSQALPSFADSSITKVPSDVSISPQASPPRLSNFKKGFRKSKVSFRSLSINNLSIVENPKQMNEPKKEEKKARIKSKKRNQRARKVLVKPANIEPTLILKKVVSASALDILPDDTDVYQSSEILNSNMSPAHYNNQDCSDNESDGPASPEANRLSLTTSLPDLENIIITTNDGNDDPKIDLQISNEEVRVLCFENLSQNSSSSSDRFISSHENFITNNEKRTDISRSNKLSSELALNNKYISGDQKSSETDYVAHNLKKLCTVQIALEANLKSLNQDIRNAMNDNDQLYKELVEKRHIVVQQQINSDNRYVELITISEANDLEEKERLLRKEYENKMRIDVTLKSKEQLWEEEILWKDIQELLERRREKEDQINKQIIRENLETASSNTTIPDNNLKNSKPSNSKIFVCKKEQRSKADGSSWGDLFGKIYSNLV